MLSSTNPTFNKWIDVSRCVKPELSGVSCSRCGFSSSPAAIEACLGHLLKRRAAGFLRSDKIAALFTKVGKVYDTAGEICRKVQEQLQQQADLTRLVPPLSSLSLCGQVRPLSSTPRHRRRLASNRAFTLNVTETMLGSSRRWLFIGLACASSISHISHHLVMCVHASAFSRYQVSSAGGGVRCLLMYVFAPALINGLCCSHLGAS